MNILKTYGNPIKGTRHVCLWTSESFRFVGYGAREIQDMCEKQGIRWEVFYRTNDLFGIEFWR